MSNDQDMTNDNDGRGERESMTVTVRLHANESPGGTYKGPRTIRYP